MKRLLLLAALALFLATSLVAGQGDTFEGETLSIRIGGNATVNATLVNPLPIEDTFNVIFRGDAITGGLVTPFYTSTDGISCEALNDRCTVQMEPNEEKDVQIILNGTAIGQEPLIATVNSTNTQLSSTDRMEIRVKPFFGRATVSAPGIQGLHIAVIALLGALAAGFFFRETER